MWIHRPSHLAYRQLHPHLQPSQLQSAAASEKLPNLYQERNFFTKRRHLNYPQDHQYQKALTLNSFSILDSPFRIFFCVYVLICGMRNRPVQSSVKRSVCILLLAKIKRFFSLYTLYTLIVLQGISISWRDFVEVSFNVNSIYISGSLIKNKRLKTIYSAGTVS